LVSDGDTPFHRSFRGQNDTYVKLAFAPLEDRYRAVIAVIDDAASGLQ
jgi:hypothetical protein